MHLEKRFKDNGSDFLSPLFETILSHSNDIVLVVTKAKELVCFNDSAEKIFGNAKKIKNIIAGHLNLNARKTFLPNTLVINKEKVVIQWKKIRLPKGRTGTTDPYMLIGRNVTQRDQLARKLYNLEYIIKKVPGYVFWKDSDSVLIGCNENFARQVGFKSPEAIVGKSDHDLPWTKEQTTAFLKDDQEIMKTRRPKLNIEEPQRQADGKEAFLLTSKVPTYSQEGDVTGVLGTYIDITQLKETEKQLRLAKEQAEVANETKTQFIANMEHDLRTPCAGISEAAKLLEYQEAGPEKREILHNISNASSCLLKILNGILDFSNIESGLHGVIDKKFRIRQILEDVITIEAPTAKLKKLRLTVDCQKNVPDMLVGDEHRLTRIILNLMSNAVKFTIKGQVAILVKLAKGIRNRNVILQIMVSDTGIGIPKNKQAMIYERFVRITPSNRGIFEGSGLGLSIVKKFVTELGGELDVESDVGCGTIFTCTLPFKLPLAVIKPRNTVVKHVSAMDNDQELSILLVEDNDFIRKATSIMLDGEFSNALSTAATGKEALKQVATQAYDLILMDLGLPDMTGYEVAQKIRHGNANGNNKTPIIALSAHSAAIAKENSMASSLDDYYTKPLDINKMRRIIKKWVRR